jgi:Protein of unknown function (DUF4012)
MDPQRPSRTAPPKTGLIGAAAVLLSLAGALMWVAMLAAPWRLVTGLVDAGRHLERGEQSLSVTALKEAQYEVFAGAAAAERADAGYDAPSPLTDIARLIPKARSALDEVDHLVAASDFSAQAALGTLRIAKNALRGPTRIIATDPESPEDSEIRLDRIEKIAGSIAKIHTNLDGVQAELAAVDLQSLPRRVRPSVTDGLDKAEEAEAVIADAQAGFEVLPAVLGADEPRTYLIGMQNPAEQRGTGGAILRFSLFTFDQGKSDFDKCDPQDSACGKSVYDIDRNRRLYNIDLPKDAWYVDGIEDAQRFGNSNWSPDWPSSAQLMLEYGETADERLGGDQLPEVDGFITLDPIVMEDLIPGAGPFKLEDFGNKITANKAVHFLLYKAYASYPRHGLRRAALRRVVDQFIDRLLDPQHPTELVTGMGESLGSKHMLIWMKDPDEQAFIERMDWDGGIEDVDGADYVYMVEQNVGGNKFDYYTEHATSMDITLEGSDAEVSTETTISNGTFFPQPSWAMGDSGRPDPEGNPQVPTHEPMMNLYVPEDAELSNATVDGSRMDVPLPAVWTNGSPPEHEEHGKKVWSATLQIPPGEDGSVRFDYRVPGVVREDDNGRLTYRLVVQHQPRVRPETMDIHLTLPEGASAIVAPEWDRIGETLVWSKPLRRDVILKVTWA